MKILITGSNGQLGSELRFLSLNDKSHNWIFTDIKELDLSDLKNLSKNISKIAPCIIVNCAAFTHVEMMLMNLLKLKKG